MRVRATFVLEVVMMEMKMKMVIANEYGTEVTRFLRYKRMSTWGWVYKAYCTRKS